MHDSDRDASEALLALGSATVPPVPLSIDLSEDKENLDEFEHVKVLSKERKDPHVECNYCEHQFFGGATRIRAHLAKQAKVGVKICDKVPSQVFLAFREKANAIADKAKKLQDQKDARANLASQSKYSFNPIRVDNQTNFVFRCIGASSHLGTIPGLWALKNADDVDSAVAKFFYGNAISFNVAENHYFRDMCSAIAKYGSSYKPPAATQLRTTMLEKVKKEVDVGLQVQFSVCKYRCMFYY